jgi:hypothetical protein
MQMVTQQTSRTQEMIAMATYSAIGIGVAKTATARKMTAIVQRAVSVSDTPKNHRLRIDPSSPPD